jgi:hypothetical protein
MAFRERKEVKGGLFGMASLPIAICAVLVLPCAQVLSINKSWNGVLGRILSVCVVFPFPCNETHVFMVQTKAHSNVCVFPKFTHTLRNTCMFCTDMS